MALDLGIFMPVANNGWIMSPSAPADPPTFALNRWVAQEAERSGFHFLLAQSVWRGHGGRTQFWDVSLEGFTLMSALAGVTDRIGLIASCQPLLYPAPVAAKLVATADEVSGGRFGLNIVAGGNLSEAEQMGLLLEDWGAIRYDYAAEWMEVVRSLWEKDRTTYQGRWMSVADCVSGPKPRQGVDLPIIAAGASAKGRAFAGRFASHAFIGAKDIEALGQVSREYKAAAREQGRSVKTYTTLLCHVVDREAAGNAYRQRFVEDPDLEAVADLVRQYSRKGAGESLKKDPGYNPGDHVFFGDLLAGTPARIADRLRALEGAGLDGVLLHFTEWSTDLPRFVSEVKPLAPEIFAAPDRDWRIAPA
jgi:pyrimidine oxygenase